MKTYCVSNPPPKESGVREIQQALKKAKLYNGPLDGIFSAGTGDGCYRAKYRFGYPIKSVNRCGGQNLLDFLSGAKKLPPTYIVRRHARGFGISKSDKQRAAIVRYCNWAIAHEPQITYHQTRPMDHLNKVEVLPWDTDCSEFVTTIYKWAGAPDPNGLGYNGQGWTGTLLDHGTTIPIWQAHPGDVVIWGAHPGHHTAIILDVTNPHDPDLGSHGENSGPKRIKFSVETKYQNRPVTVKRYLK